MVEARTKLFLCVRTHHSRGDHAFQNITVTDIYNIKDKRERERERERENMKLLAKHFIIHNIVLKKDDTCKIHCIILRDFNLLL